MGNRPERRTIEGIERGYPVDVNGHYLDRDDIEGGEARPLTDPYGSLEWVIGSDDDFVCFDFHELEDVGKVILHATVNSETGHFIEDREYLVCDKKDAPEEALRMVMDHPFDDVEHDEKGHGQDRYYFYRSVFVECVLPYYRREANRFSENSLRFGGDEIDKFCDLKRITVTPADKEGK
jgi:hypothetical protein